MITLHALTFVEAPLAAFALFPPDKFTVSAGVDDGADGGLVLDGPETGGSVVVVDGAYVDVVVGELPVVVVVVVLGDSVDGDFVVVVVVGALVVWHTLHTGQLSPVLRCLDSSPHGHEGHVVTIVVGSGVPMVVGSAVVGAAVVGHGLHTGQCSPFLRILLDSTPHGQVGHGDFVVGDSVVGHSLQTGQ
jgi:hypothetical protein